jgi:hypothetical protein
VKASVEEPVAKLSRAYVQLVILQQEIQARFPPAKLWPLMVKEHRPGLEYRLYLGDIPGVDPNWTLATSEILFNIRCSLDYLVFQLHVRRYRGNVPPVAAKASMFPIYDNETMFNQHGARRIKNLGESERRAIRHLQPYVTRNDGWKYTRLFLAQLSSLQDLDKHRKLHVVAAAQAATFTPSFPQSCGLTVDLTRSPVKSGDHVQTWTFTSPPPEMKDNDGAILAVAIEHGGQMMALLGTLSELANNVSFVIERFADRFPKIPRPIAWCPGWSPPYLPKGARPPLRHRLFL